jgi:hypothetical protein
VWGCNAQIRVPSQLRTKLKPKSFQGIFIGYASSSKGYRFYDAEKKRLIESRDVVFLDEDTPRRAKRARVELLATPLDTSQLNAETDSNNQENPSTDEINVDTPSTSLPRRSGRNVAAPSYLDDYYVFMGEVHSKTSSLEEEPKSFKHAMSCLESKLWMEAMREELDSMKRNKVWELVDLPNNCKPVGSKWIFKKKLNASGCVEKYKAETCC